MYEIHFRRKYDSREDYSRIGKLYATVIDARKARQVSGDLVVHAATHEVVKNRLWLFDWELNDTNCYAMQAIQNAIPIAYD